jgi:hypothetical protein
MTAINPREYWPQYWDNHLGVSRFMYIDKTGQQPPFSSVFAHDATLNSMTLNQYDASNVWQNTWFLRLGVQGLIEEWRDDTPLTGWEAMIFGSKKTVLLEPAITWGGDAQEIGRIAANIPEIQGLKSVPPQLDQNGFQAVAFESVVDSFTTDHGVYNDVLVMSYQQTFNKKTAGARFWMAHGIGPIAQQWMVPNLAAPGTFITSPRMDAILTNV